jgi:hypothetical protein
MIESVTFEIICLRNIYLAIYEKSGCAESLTDLILPIVIARTYISSSTPSKAKSLLWETAAQQRK